MEQYLGRKLGPTEIVHHIDKNPFNNDINNLEIITRKMHIEMHSEIKVSAIHAKTKHRIDYEKVYILFVKKRLPASEIGEILGISQYSISWFIRKHKIKRPILKCKVCNNSARYPESQLCNKCYQKSYYANKKTA